MNLLLDYIPDSLPHGGLFTTAPGLTRKVGADGTLLPFRGNTTVFLLEGEVRRELEQLQRRLHEAVPRMLARPLSPDTFHMTLHDLENQGRGEEGLEERMELARVAATELLKKWPKEAVFSMKTSWMFNMVNTSIVLGLTPSDRETEKALDSMYEALESVVPLGYPLTPHITLAYFRPGVYDRETVEALRRVLGPVELAVTLRGEDLQYQTFSSMNAYF